MHKWALRSLGALVVLGLAVVAAWYAVGPVPVDTARPTRGPAVEAVYGSGTVEPSVMLPIASKLAGRVQRLLADEGEDVRQGDILAELDNRELAALVEEWSARLRYSEAQFRRASELFRSRTGTEAALDQARNELDTARAQLDRARRQLAEMTLTAPAAGLVIRRDSEIGQLVQPGEALFWIACCGPLRVAAEIDEEDIRAVKPGQRALLHADAFPGRIFEGAVAQITPKGDPVQRSFRVRIALPANSPLMIGMTVEANIIVDERSNALLVPASAVVDGKIWLVRDGVAVKRPVTVGVTGDRNTEILSGLSDDDLFVVDPGAGLRDGRPVRPRAVQ